jgi:hypothetical protein
MHAANLLESLRELSPESAERWIAAALAEAAALRGHDDSLYPSEEDSAGLTEAGRIRDAWRQWAADAELLLQQVDAATKGTTIPGADRVAYEVGRARAMLTVTPEKVQAARRQVAEGKTVSSEEARRELGYRLAGDALADLRGGYRFLSRRTSSTNWNTCAPTRRRAASHPSSSTNLSAGSLQLATSSSSDFFAMILVRR